MRTCSVTGTLLCSNATYHVGMCEYIACSFRIVLGQWYFGDGASP